MRNLFVTRKDLTEIDEALRNRSRIDTVRLRRFMQSRTFLCDEGYTVDRKRSGIPTIRGAFTPSTIWQRTALLDFPTEDRGRQIRGAESDQRRRINHSR